MYYSVTAAVWLTKCFNRSLQIISLQSLLLIHKIRLQTASGWQATGSTLPVDPAMASSSNKPDGGGGGVWKTLCTTSHTTCVPRDFTQLLCILNWKPHSHTSTPQGLQGGTETNSHVYNPTPRLKTLVKLVLRHASQKSAKTWEPSTPIKYQLLIFFFFTFSGKIRNNH